MTSSSARTCATRSSRDVITRVTFTDPQVCAVGLTSAQAKEPYTNVRVVDYGTGDVSGAYVRGNDIKGTSRIVVDDDRRVIVGATFTGPDVQELLHSATVAIIGQVTLDRLWHAVPSFPTVSEVWLRLLGGLRALRRPATQGRRISHRVRRLHPPADSYVRRGDRACTRGSGPPVLLLHGAPQTHVMWHAVAPGLADSWTVVASDLRGYGDSSKPTSEPDHAAYSFRAMALDQVEVMRALGFDRFCVVGHDRGARVAHRLVRDHPGTVERVALLDIVPTDYVYSHVDRALATAYYHWFLLIQPAPLPERMIEPTHAGSCIRRSDPSGVGARSTRKRRWRNTSAASTTRR